MNRNLFRYIKYYNIPSVKVIPGLVNGQEYKNRQNQVNILKHIWIPTIYMCHESRIASTRNHGNSSYVLRL